MTFEYLNKNNVEKYINYLKECFHDEPEMMTSEVLDLDGIRKRIDDPFYLNTKSILAILDDKVIGRLEYHFYGCMQDGYRMCYIDWVYVKKTYRHQGVAQSLFKELEKACKENKINQYYLIRAKNPDANKFCNSFKNSSLDNEPILRKEFKNYDE